MDDAVTSLKKCIVLIGGMGCGKSTIGQQLKKDTHLPLVDLDHFIEEHEKMTVSEIFAQKGEEYFRDLETFVLKTLLEEKTPDGCIISTGGGIVKKEENRKLLKQLGFVVWINLPPEIAYERISRNKDRPLLHTPNPLETLVSLGKERAPLYREIADLVIETAQLNSQETAFGIIESARHHFSNPEDNSSSREEDRETRPQ